MLRKILASSVIFFTTISPSFAESNRGTFSSVPTPYGQLHCLERAQKKFIEIGATYIFYDVNASLRELTSASIWGRVDNDTVIGVWCRGHDVIIGVNGKNIYDLKNEIKSAF